MFDGRTARAWCGVRSGLSALTDLLYPPVCAVCGSAGLSGAELLCKPCLESVAQQCASSYCPTCLRTVPPFAIHDGKCHLCRDLRLRIAGAVRVGPYRDHTRAVLRAFKYERRWVLGEFLARRLADQLRQARWFDDVDALVTVPRWWPRRVLKGDYPPAQLAKRLSRAVGVSVIPVLRRTSGGPSQVGLSRAQRIENVKGKFATVRGARVDGATLCLVDDVMTTGATIDECAKTLLAAGAREVYAAVVAHASKDAATQPRAIAHT